MIDTAELLKMLAEFSEDIETEHPDAELGTFAVVVEIGDADGNWTMIAYRCNDARRWVQQGFFTAAVEAVENTHSRVDDEDE